MSAPIANIVGLFSNATTGMDKGTYPRLRRIRTGSLFTTCTTESSTGEIISRL